MQLDGGPILKKNGPLKAATWAGEDGRAKGEGRYDTAIIKVRVHSKELILDLFFFELSLDICSLGEVMTGVPREGVGSTHKWFNIG